MKKIYLVIDWEYQEVGQVPVTKIVFSSFKKATEYVAEKEKTRDSNFRDKLEILKVTLSTPIEY